MPPEGCEGGFCSLGLRGHGPPLLVEVRGELGLVVVHEAFVRYHDEWNAAARDVDYCSGAW